MSYIISKKAQSDLTNIWEFTFNHWSADQADRYVKLISDNFSTIDLNPDVGKNYSGIRSNYRGLQVKSHIIFYQINNANQVRIIRKLHMRMDLENRMKKI